MVEKEAALIGKPEGLCGAKTATVIVEILVARSPIKSHIFSACSPNRQKSPKYLCPCCI